MPGRVKEVNERPNAMFKDNVTYRRVRKGKKCVWLSGVDQDSLLTEESSSNQLIRVNYILSYTQQNYKGAQK